MKDAYSYPLLEKISHLYEPQKKPYKDVYILACQHILKPQAKMFELISDFGIPKENIQIFGKIYSTSNEILNGLRSADFKVSKPIFNPAIPFDIEHAENCKKELNAFVSNVFLSSIKSSPGKSPSKIIILDDGGELLKAVNDAFGHSISPLPPDTAVIGIEQTSSGFRKLEHTPLHFPIFNVARSDVKLVKESPLIAHLGCDRIVDVIKQYSISEPRILVVGLGPIGSNTFSILKDKGYFVIGYDIAQHDATELITLVNDNAINILIGATGANILNEKQLKEIKDTLNYKLYLISMSSADREFPTTYIRKNGITPAEIHGDAVWDNLTLINNGFPITFKGKRYESTPEEIEITIGLLYGSTLEAIVGEGRTGEGFVEVPGKVGDVLEKSSGSWRL
jgi:S-adenosylhomocysteine hydrolase